MTFGVTAAGVPVVDDPGLELRGIDGLLLSAFGAIAGIGIWTHCLLVNDGAVFLLAGWLGDAWDLFFGQSAARGLSVLASFGPVWFLRWSFGLTSSSYLFLGHLLYFAVPLVLWLLIRRIEPQPLFSRLYLAASLALVYFPSEFNVGLALWLMAMAVAADPARSDRQVLRTTLGLGLALVFTHPAFTAMSGLYVVAAGVLVRLGRPVPQRTVVVAGALSLLLLAGYLSTSRLLAPSNPTIALAFATNSHGFWDPRWWIAALLYSPMLLALWLLLLAPGVPALGTRYRVPPLALAVVAAFGLWFAVNGVGSVTWVQARQSGGYMLALALALAMASRPSAWLAAAHRPLGLFVVVMLGAALSYGVDLALLEQLLRRNLAPGYVSVATLDLPAKRAPRSLRRTLFKWTAGPDYGRDVVVPAYDWFLITLAYQTFFLSDREAVLYHRLPADFWRPFECPAVRRALAQAHDEPDAQLLRFIVSEGYCV